MKKIILYSLVVLLAIGAYIGYTKYAAFFLPNVPTTLSNNLVQIPSGATFDEVVDILDSGGYIVNKESFIETAEQMKYKKANMRTGQYKIQAGWSNRDLIKHLRGGNQETVKVTFNNKRMTENVAAEVSQYLQFDSLALQELFVDESYLEEIGYTKETLMSLFIPNTYDMYWNTTPKKFMERMIKEHKNFWESNDRLAKAKAKGLSKAEVATMASIVEKETNHNPEKRRMAGVYYNRVKIGMPLQADPTCVFATRDFSTKRVTNYHLEFDSPYNTYMYPGLPPGPIAMPSIASLDAVLNAEEHQYLYFCAKGNGTGQHNFAKTLSQHNRNAAIYVRNLRERGKR